MQTEIEAAKAAYLASGGKITELDGFTSIKPLPEAEIAGGLVDRRYIARKLGLSVKSLFSPMTANRHLLPKPVGRNQYGGFVYEKSAADAAIQKIKKILKERANANA